MWGVSSRGQGEAPDRALSFTGLLAHLATLTRNHLRVVGHDETGFDLIAVSTPTQRAAFELLHAPSDRIPSTQRSARLLSIRTTNRITMGSPD